MTAILVQRGSSMRRTVSVVGVLSAGLAGCSIALDFDRSFPDQEIAAIFPKEQLDGDSSGEVVPGKCREFCDLWIGCLASPEACHMLAISDESQTIARDDCLVGCAASGLLTEGRLRQIQDPATCERAAREFVKAHSNDVAFCNERRKACEVLCGRPLGKQDVLTCLAQEGESCKAACEAMSAEFWDCALPGLTERNEPQKFCSCAQEPDAR